MKNLAEKIGYKFKNEELLRTALTHSSYANEQRGRGIESNERLEFLGDSVLGIVSAEHLYKEFPRSPEGVLTKHRAALVCEQSLHETAVQLGLGEDLRLGHGEERGDGRQRPSILADAVEAVIAAIYLDGGFKPATDFIEKYILVHEKHASSDDYKTKLQERVQHAGKSGLTYILTDAKGPDHMKEFFVDVRLGGETLGSGSGRSKKEAEQQAAKMALEKFGKHA